MGLILASWRVLTSAEDIHSPAQIVQEGTTEIQARQFESARRLLEQGVRKYRANADVWNLLGIADAELQRNEEAKSAFEHGLHLAPDSIPLNENIGLLFYKKADYASTRRFLQRAVELGSKQPPVLFSLAAAQLRTGERSEALATLKTLEPALSNLPGYWEERGRAELVSDAPQAEFSFGHALELQPNSIAALNGAATAAERQGFDEKALAYLVKAKMASPDDIETLAHFGAVCIRRDLGPDAIEALDRAHRLDPKNNAVLFLLARANISVQNWQQAYDLFDELSKRVPDYAGAFYAMGWIDIRLDRVQDARRLLEHALALEPGLIDARYDLAQLNLDGGQFDTAEKQLSEVLKQDPNYAKANAALGEILLRKGDLDGAQAHLEKAVEKDPGLASAHYRLSTVLFRKHLTERAERERTLAAGLQADAQRANRTQLKLALPEMESNR